MTVSSIMTRNVVQIGMDTSIQEIGRVFAEFGFHHVLVVDEGALMGVISDRDVLLAISPFVGAISELDRDRHTLHRRAHQVMTRHPVTVRPDTPVQEATRSMLTNGISCLPVLDEQGGVLGIITWRDLLRWHLDDPS